jgi:ABC-type lipoprotein export system ATPase subunit
VSEPLLRLRRLSKVFGEGETRVQAVSGVDLELERGEIVLVMGPSGSGKTTLLSMLGGLLRPSAGEIVINGVDIAALPERELPPFRAERSASSSRTSTCWRPCARARTLRSP